MRKGDKATNQMERIAATSLAWSRESDRGSPYHGSAQAKPGLSIGSEKCRHIRSFDEALLAHLSGARTLSRRLGNRERQGRLG